VYGKSRKHHEGHCFILFWWISTQAHVKQIAEMKTSDPNYGKTVFLTVTISSMLPEIIHNILFNLWKSKETPWKIQISFILMNFHSSTPKTDCKNEITRSILSEISLFDYLISSVLPEINSQNTFQCWKIK